MTHRAKIELKKRFIPTIARLCIMASTIEDSLRYWREYGIYINYFGNLWTKDRLISALSLLIHRLLSTRQNKLLQVVELIDPTG